MALLFNDLYWNVSDGRKYVLIIDHYDTYTKKFLDLMQNKMP